MPLIRLHDFQAQFGLHQPSRKLAKHLQIAGTFSRQNWMGLRWPRPSSLPLGPLRLLRNEIFTEASTDMPNQDARFVACTAELHRQPPAGARNITESAPHLHVTCMGTSSKTSTSGAVRILSTNTEKSNKNVPALTCLTFTLTFQTSTFQQAPQEKQKQRRRRRRAQKHKQTCQTFTLTFLPDLDHPANPRKTEVEAERLKEPIRAGRHGLANR